MSEIRKFLMIFDGFRFTEVHGKKMVVHAEFTAFHGSFTVGFGFCLV